MVSVSFVTDVALVRKKSELKLRILNGHGAAVQMEREPEATSRPRADALGAVLKTARVSRRTPDTVSARQVEGWGWSN